MISPENRKALTKAAKDLRRLSEQGDVETFSDFQLRSIADVIELVVEEEKSK